MKNQHRKQLNPLRCVAAALIITIIFAACGSANPAQDSAADDYAPQASTTNEHVPAEDAAHIDIPTGEATDNPPEITRTIIPLTLSYVMEAAAVRRRDIEKPGLDVAHGLAATRPPHGESSISVASLQQANPNPASSITREEAIADAAAFFEILRTYYGAYTYFGGDAVFLPLLDDITAHLHTEETWSFANFADLIVEAVRPHIRDNHVSVNGVRLGISYGFYEWRTAFDRTADGFLHRETNRLVADVPGHDIDDLFRLATDAGGDLFYMPVVVCAQNPATYTLTVYFTTGESETVQLRRFSSARHGNHETPVRLDRVGDVPVITIRSMGFPDSPHGNNSADARFFLNLVDQLRAEPVIIIDGRSNGGGYGQLHRRFLHSLLGEIVPQNYFGLRTGTVQEQIQMMANQSIESWSYIDADVFFTYADIVELDDRHILMTASPRRIINNEQLIVLLIDRHTASAGEGFADAMLNVQNTLIIGQNTGGVLHTDLTYPSLFLPHSHMRFGLGTTINVHPHGHLPEGIGLAPDVWFVGNMRISDIVDFVTRYSPSAP